MPADEDLDLGAAAAESRLARMDREDDRDPEANTLAGTLDLSRVDADGLHLESDDPDPYAVGDDDLEDVHDPADAISVIDAFNEAFNARDLDALLDLLADDCETPGLGNDCENFADAVEDLWERRPTSMLTRGDLDGLPLAVMWEVGDTGAWWRVAPVTFDAIDDGRVGVVELADDASGLDGVVAESPDDDLDEGARWAEWDEGAAV